MSNLNNNPPRGLPGEIDQRPLVSRSSAPVRRAAAPIDEPEFELTDLAWIALKVAHCTDVPVRELRWSFCGDTRSRQARTIFLLVSRELVGAKLRRLAWYVGRDEAEIEAELILATDSEKRRAQDIATALVIERRRTSGDASPLASVVATSPIKRRGRRTAFQTAPERARSTTEKSNDYRIQPW